MIRLSLRHRLYLLMGCVVAGFLLVGGVSWSTIETLKVNGPLYLRIVQGKDLIADILPPPEYIIESYLVTLQMSHARSGEEIAALAERLVALQKDYDARHDFWLGEGLEPDLHTMFLERSTRPALAFFALARGDYLTTLGGDRARAMELLGELRRLYEQHRQVIDQVVAYTNERNARFESEARQTIAAARIQAGLIFVLVLMLTGGLGLMISRSLLRELGGELEEVLALVRRIAAGDLSQVIAGRPDGHDLLSAMAGMAGRLRELIGQMRQAGERERDAAQALVEIAGALTRDAAEMRQRAVAGEESTVRMSREIAHIAAKAEESHGQMRAVASFAEQAAGSMNTISAAAEESNVTLSSVSQASSEADATLIRANRAAGEAAVRSTAVSREVGGMEQVLRNLREELEKAREASRHAAAHAAENAAIMGQLVNSTSEIDRVVALIGQVASQTNMLALNAAIEAAGAGEAGKGFAVVAGEVKELARQTADATRQILNKVEEIQGYSRKVHEVGAAVDAANQRLDTVNARVLSTVEEQSRATQAILGDVEHFVGEVEQVNRMVDDSASRVSEVSRRATEIAGGIAEVTRSVSQASEGIQETARRVHDAFTQQGDIATVARTMAEEAKEVSRGIAQVNQVVQGVAEQSARLQEESRRMQQVSQDMERLISRFRL